MVVGNTVRTVQCARLRVTGMYVIVCVFAGNMQQLHYVKTRQMYSRWESFRRSLQTIGHFIGNVSHS